MKLSVVTTVYYSSDTINLFYQQINREVKKITNDFEIIVVDDGSNDDSLAKLLTLQSQDKKLIVIELSRNFGHHQAGLIGLRQAKGDFVFLLDSDLEEPPELIHKFWDVLQKNQELFVAYGVQKKRTGNFFTVISGQLFYKLFNYLAYINLAENIMTIRLMKRDYVNALLQYPERIIFLGGMMAHAGFKQQALELDKVPKAHSAYTVRKRICLLINSLVSFSNKPFYFLFIAGLLLFILSSLGLLIMGLQKDFSLTFGLMFTLSLWVCSVFLSVSGLLGIYLSVVVQEVKQRPLAIIKKIYQ